MIVQSSCARCVFAKIKDDKQTGCVLNRTEKIEETSRETINDTEYSILSRFCNTYRPEHWMESLTLEQKMNADGVVMDEVRPRIGFLIHLDHKKEDPIQELKKTLTDIKNQSESLARYVIVSNSKVEYNEEIHSILSSYFDTDKTEIHIVQLLGQPLNNIWIIDEAFKLTLNGWLYVTTSGEHVDKNMMKDVHSHINIKLKKLSIVMPYEDINGLLFQTALFKYLNGNKTKVWDKDNSDSRPFLEKVKDLDENGDCILEWSEVNAT